MRYACESVLILFTILLSSNVHVTMAADTILTAMGCGEVALECLMGLSSGPHRRHQNPRCTG